VSQRLAEGTSFGKQKFRHVRRAGPRARSTTPRVRRYATSDYVRRVLPTFSPRLRRVLNILYGPPENFIDFCGPA